jgi:hypothetical protein
MYRPVPALELAVASLFEEVDRPTPGRLASYIEANLARPRPKGWLGRFLEAPNVRDYHVTRIALVQDGGFFQQARVLEVWVRGLALEGHLLPAGGTFGLFAVDARGLRYLSRRQAEVERLLRAENKPLDAFPPLLLARLLAEALLREGNVSEDVLADADALTTYGGGTVRGYKIDLAEQTRIQKELVPPSVTPSGAGWEVEFCALRGWMHAKQMLVRHLFRVGADHHLHDEPHVLSAKMFKSVPWLRY